jgi:hypothetical protein
MRRAKGPWGDRGGRSESSALRSGGRQRVELAKLDSLQSSGHQLAALVERVLGYKRFPLRFANILVPGIRIDRVPMDREPTLLDALFDSNLENLP